MRSILLQALKHTTTISSSLGGRKLLILIYHRVLDKPDFMRPGEVDRALFSMQMELMAKYYNVLSLNEALSRLQNNNLPPRAVCITFDDGYADNYYNALPILKNRQLPATFFIATGFLNGGRMWNDTIIEAIRNMPSLEINLTEINFGKFDISSASKKIHAAQNIIRKFKYLHFEDRKHATEFVTSLGSELPGNLMLTTDELVKLFEAGMEIGGHTVNHPIMAKLETNELNKEISENKKTLEETLNTEIKYFAYPNGKPGQDYLPEQVQIVKEHGYKAALSTQWGVAMKKKADTYQLPRFTPWEQEPEKFMKRIAYIYGKDF